MSRQTDRERFLTRDDYMTGKCSFQEYYLAIAHDAGISMAGSKLLERCRKALASGDEHLNTITLKTWDNIAAYQRRAVAPVLKEHGDGWSMAGGVCVAKAAMIKAVKDTGGIGVPA